MTRLFWYPPAETRIRLRFFAQALLAKYDDDDFEKLLCSYLGVRSCVLGSSGRALMTLLLQSLKVSDTQGRNEVLIPAYTCYSVAASVARAGLKIAVYDLDPRTLRPDMDSLGAAAGHKTLAVVFQHLFGIPQPVKDFEQTATGYGITLIEDAAQGLGGFLNGRPLGALGDYGIFSFGRGKPLPIGTGGALTASDKIPPVVPAQCTSAGWGKLARGMAVQALSHPMIYGMMERLPLGLGKTIFDPGFAIAGMPEAAKRLAKSSFAGMHTLNSHRRAIAAVYKSRLQGASAFPEPEGSEPVYTRFPLPAGPRQIGPGLSRLGVRRMYPRAITSEPVIGSYLARPVQDTPGARHIAENLVTLPTHSRITAALAHDICSLLEEEYPW